MNQAPTISYYNGVRDKRGTQLTVTQVIDFIISNKEFAIQIEALRKLKKAEYDETKKILPAVTWSGTFQQRKVDQLDKYSGLICLDIDHLPSDVIKSSLTSLSSDQFTMLVFISPSGTGLKVVIKVEGGPDEHLANFHALEKYYHAEYHLTIDPSGKDVSRLCFLSADPSAVVNYDSIVFSHRNMPGSFRSSNTSLSKKEQSTFLSSDDDLDQVYAFTQNKVQYVEGNRNNFIYLFAANCNRKAVDINDCLNYVLSFAADLPSDEITSTIKSAYDHHSYETGKYAKRQARAVQVSKRPTKQSNSNSLPAVPVEESYIRFWWVTIDENKKDEDGEPLKRYNVKYNCLIEFLEAAGFYRLQLPNNRYEYIMYKNGIAEPVGIVQMKDHVFNFLRAKELDGVLEMMRRGAKSYFTPPVMEGLAYKALQFRRDTAEEAFFYFQNCMVRVTKEGVKTEPYTASQSVIWASSMIKKEFTPVPVKLPLAVNGDADPVFFDQCEMAKYILLVSHNPHSTEGISEEDANGRFLSLCSSIGYMLHGYKSRISKAIVAVDHKIPEDKSEQNGGTGKSIVGNSFRHLKSTTLIDGREFKEDYAFKYERIGVDTKIVVMQDCKRNLDFGSFFVPITDDFTYNRRYLGMITIPFEDSAKFWFDSNFVPGGEGSSFKRRMHVIEFDDYFNENHNPYDEFGHLLFQDWEAEQWNLFFNFYLYCVQLYLTTGLIAYPKSNYESRKLVSEAPAEFIDWMDATDSSGIFLKKRNDWFEKKELLKAWNNEAKELSMQPTTPHMLTKWVKKYCHARPFRLLRDKTNGVEWWLLADDNYKGSGKKSEKTEANTAELLF